MVSIDIKGKNAAQIASLIGAPHGISLSRSHLTIIPKDPTTELITVTGYDDAWPFSLPRSDILIARNSREQLIVRVAGDVLYVSLGGTERVTTLKSLLEPTKGCGDQQFRTIDLPAQDRRFLLQFDRASVTAVECPLSQPMEPRF